VPLNEPSETELLDRIAKVIANKSELAPYRQYLDRITKRKAEIAAGDPLTRKIQEARANGQWSSVVAHVRHQAERGNPVFLTAMAQMHATGLGTPANLELSLDMFAKAASQNYAPAQFQVGYFLITTTGNLKNTATGSRLLESATAQGYSEAEFAMGQLAHSGALSPVDEAKAFEWYEKAAKQGFSKAWTNHGDLSATART
jgi:TPR repeat protein